MKHAATSSAQHQPRRTGSSSGMSDTEKTLADEASNFSRNHLLHFRPRRADDIGTHNAEANDSQLPHEVNSRLQAYKTSFMKAKLSVLRTACIRLGMSQYGTREDIINRLIAHLSKRWQK